MFKFSLEVEVVLKKSGWFPDRNIDVSSWVEDLLAEGYSYIKSGEKILQNLGGLSITPISGPNCAFISPDFIFDPLLTGCLGIDLLQSWENDIGNKLFPIGVDSESFRILIDDQERIFCASSDEMYLYGDSIEKAMDILVLAKSKPILMYS